MGQRGLAVVGVYEIEKGPGLQFIKAPSQLGCPHWVQALEVSIETGNAQQVERVVEEMGQFILACCVRADGVSRPSASRRAVIIEELSPCDSFFFHLRNPLPLFTKVAFALIHVRSCAPHISSVIASLEHLKILYA